MAVVCKIGPTTDFYDLTDRTTNGHLFIKRGGVKNTKWDDKEGVWIEVIELAAHSSTHANIVNYEEDIVDHLKEGELFVTNKQNSAPVWYYESADNETEKRALVHGGTLLPVVQQQATRLMERDKAFYVLTIRRGPWEQTSVTTILSAQTMDGVTNTKALSTIKGDVPGRISQTLIRGTATNTEAAPLTKVWAGIRREYGGVTLFDPVLDLEYATLVNETTVTSIDDSNTYPNGSSASNALLVTFGDTVYEKRATMSLGSALQVTNLVTNGDAETGDLTGWDDTDAGWAADDSAVSTGTYGFYADLTGSDATIYQQIVAVDGDTIHFSYDYEVYVSSSSADYIAFYVTFYDVGDNTLSVFRRKHVDINGDFASVEGMVVAPDNTTYATVTLNANSFGGGTIEGAFDDIALFTVPAVAYRGSYTALARAKLSAAGDVDIQAKFGYTSSSTLNAIGAPQKMTNTDWKLIPLGNATFPPGRMLSDVDAIWRMNNLGFEIYAQKIADTDSCNLLLDALILVPSRQALHVDGFSVCRSSYTIDDSGTTYNYADLDVRVSEADETIIIAEAEDFLGIDTAILPSVVNWEIPNEDGVFVCFAERAASHQIADDFVVTVKYVPRYDFRNTD